MASYIVYLTTILLAAGAANALECYACEGPACGFGLLSFAYPKVQCDQRTGYKFLDVITSIVPSQCVKLVATDRNGNTYVARNCTIETGQMACNLMTGISSLASDLSNVHCYTCTTDLCNAASKNGITSITGVVVACIAYMMF